jgi:hypothetical protein
MALASGRGPFPPVFPDSQVAARSAKPVECPIFQDAGGSGDGLPSADEAQ